LILNKSKQTRSNAAAAVIDIAQEKEEKTNETKCEARETK
jgi:hypothetical protein